MKSYIFTSVILGFVFFDKAQTRQPVFLTGLLTSQKAYVTTQIQEIQRSKYLSFIHFANILLPFFPSYANLKGVIWKGNNIYYSFQLDADRGNSVFSSNGSALNSPTEHPFFMASKISTVNVSSLGFYY